MLGLLALPPTLAAQSTAFTYQGRLLDGGHAANGYYDLQFVLTDAPTNGVRVGPVLSAPAVSVTNGLFLVALDFGNTAFDGAERWLSVGVRTNGGTTPYTRLLPSQSIASIPYATFASAAASASIAITLADGGASLTSIPVSSLVGTLDGDKLPPLLAVWASLAPDAKQDTLGFAPATNSYSGITNALGYLPATNGFLAGDGTGLLVAASNIVGTVPAKLLAGQISTESLPFELPNWAGILPESKQDALGFYPATNSFTGITNALGYLPATNTAAFTNTGILYVDPNGNDDTAQRGIPSRPWATVTNAFKAIQSGDTVLIRGTHTIPSRVIGTYETSGQAFLHIGACSNVTILGDGAVLQFLGGGYGMTVSNVSHLRISGLTFVGDRSTNVLLLCGAIGFAGDNRDVEISSCRFLHWIDQVITTVVSTGVFGTRDTKIHHCYFEDQGMTNAPALGYADGACISCFFAGNIWVSDNYATNITRFFEFENAGAPLEGVEKNAYVRNNVIDDCHDWGILFYHFNAGTRFNNVHITANFIRHSNPMPWEANSICLGPCTNAIISDNIIYDNSSYHAAIFTTTIGSTNCSDRIIVERNQIYNSANNAAIYVGSSDFGTNVTFRAEIRNNLVVGSPASICSGAVYSIIEGNEIRDNLGGWPIQIINGQPLALYGAGAAQKAIVRANRLMSTAQTEWPAHILGGGADVVPYVLAEDNEDETGLPPEQLFDIGLIARLVIRHRGPGSPVGVVYAAPGSTWINENGGLFNTFFVKEFGLDSSGWSPK